MHLAFFQMLCLDSSLISQVGSFEIFSSVKYGDEKVAGIFMNLYFPSKSMLKKSVHVK